MKILNNFVQFIAGTTANAMARQKGADGERDGKAANFMIKTDELFNMQNSQYARSIRGQAEKYVLQYPIVSSDSISEDTIQTFRNQIELERATELALAISNSPIQQFDQGDFLSGFHTTVNLNENTKGVSAKRDLIKLNEDLTVIHSERLNESSLNDKTVPRDFVLEDTNFIEKMQGEFRGEKYRGAEGMMARRRKLEEYKEELNNRDNIFDEMPEDTPQERDAKDAFSKELGKDLVRWEEELTRLETDEERYEGSQTASASIQDVRKQNRSIPLMIQAKINYNLKGEVITTDTLFGVKAIIHLVTSDDTVFFLSDSARHSNFITKLVKLTTGELKFVKDILFRQDRAKRSAISSRKKNNVWKNLTSISDTENSRRYQKNFNSLVRNGIVPTTTLMLSIDEVDRIEFETGRNLLTDSKFSTTVYRELWLLDIIVVDEANEVYYKYMPGQKVFDKHLMGNLEGTRMSDGQKNKGMTTDDIISKMKKQLRGG